MIVAMHTSHDEEDAPIYNPKGVPPLGWQDGNSQKGEEYFYSNTSFVRSMDTIREQCRERLIE